MTPFVLGPEEIAELKRVCTYAENNPWSAERIKTSDISPGDDPGHSCVMPVAYRLVFTIEQQPKLGMCRHMSVSVVGKPTVPNEYMLQMVMPHLGFKNESIIQMVKMGQGSVWIENIPDGGKAVNVLEIM